MPETKNTPRILILCDFDGTVSVKDTVNRLVRDHLTDPEWRFQVKRYMRGEIGSLAVYQAIAPMMRITRGDLDEFVLNHAALDPDFPQFLEWAAERNIDVKIVSDGFGATINTLFRNHNIRGLEIFANEMEFGADGTVAMANPHSNPPCGTCGTCKLNVIRRFRSDYDRIILIGDGESDRHAAAEADMVLALHDLFVYCARSGIPAVRIEGFSDVPRLLTRRIKAVTFDMDGTLVDSIGTITDSFNHMFSKLGYPLMTEQEVARVTCISLKDFIRSYLKPEEAEVALKIFRDYYDKIYLQQASLIPGTMETLQSLNGSILQGIVTNKRGEYARKMADHFGFSKHMSRIIGAEDGFKAKPSGEMFEEFMRSAGTNTGNTVYVGDSPIDVEAAANAGIDAFVVAGNIFSAEELAHCNPRRVLNSISDLPVALQPLI
jgi:2,3-diketo-5-methylthio-1-phosphopentane phosphatase/HAD superfamily hydrolase (TIGR01509 family)